MCEECTVCAWIDCESLCADEGGGSIAQFNQFYTVDQSCEVSPRKGDGKQIQPTMPQPQGPFSIVSK